MKGLRHTLTRSIPCRSGHVETAVRTRGMTQVQSSSASKYAWLVIENHHVTGNLVTLRWTLTALEITQIGNAVPDCEASVGGCRYDGTLMEEEGRRL